MSCSYINNISVTHGIHVLLNFDGYKIWNFSICSTELTYVSHELAIYDFEPKFTPLFLSSPNYYFLTFFSWMIYMHKKSRRSNCYCASHVTHSTGHKIAHALTMCFGKNATDMSNTFRKFLSCLFLSLCYNNRKDKHTHACRHALHYVSAM